jgi:hypothetical protein
MMSAVSVALISMSFLTLFPRYWIMSCSRVDCWLLSFRCCSETAVTVEITVMSDFSTSLTQVVSVPMALVRRSSNAARCYFPFVLQRPHCFLHLGLESLMLLPDCAQLWSGAGQAGFLLPSITLAGSLQDASICELVMVASWSCKKTEVSSAVIFCDRGWTANSSCCSLLVKSLSAAR